MGSIFSPIMGIDVMRTPNDTAFFDLSFASFRSARQATHLAQVDEGDGSSGDLR